MLIMKKIDELISSYLFLNDILYEIQDEIIRNILFHFVKENFILYNYHTLKH
jgi:hypothetical protein